MNEPAEDGDEYISSTPEEILNVLTHLVGVVFAVAVWLPKLDLISDATAKLQGINLAFCQFIVGKGIAAAGSINDFHIYCRIIHTYRVGVRSG